MHSYFVVLFSYKRRIVAFEQAHSFVLRQKQLCVSPIDRPRVIQSPVEPMLPGARRQGRGKNLL